MAKSVVGPWAKDKLERLGKYLHAYTIIMKDQKWCRGFHYIDAFAGPGTHEIRQRKEDDRNVTQQALLDVARYSAAEKEQQQFLAGSPRIALELHFTNYIFIESSPERVAALKNLESEYSSTRKFSCAKMIATNISAKRSLVTSNLIGKPTAP
jgi:three-Cys-motif partner protein